MIPRPFAFPDLTGTPSCAEVDPELFFPDQGGPAKPAKAICRRCEVVEECLTWALDNDERHGIWGGLSELERRKIRRLRRAA